MTDSYGTNADRPSSLWQSDSAIWLNTSAIPEKIGAPSTVFRELRTKFKRVFLAMAASLFFMSLSPVYAAGSNGAFLVALRSVSAPGGFSGLCSKYRWVCAPSAQAGMSNGALLRLAKTVNNKVNRQTRSIEDRAQFGQEEYWTLPTARGGDCEDFALLKKKLLVEQGVASKNLLLSTVLDRRLRSHAVLVLRTNKGDFVLDNLNKKILPWKKTRYTFLKMQNPASLGNWNAILAGGIIKDRSTASVIPPKISGVQK